MKENEPSNIKAVAKRYGELLPWVFLGVPRRLELEPTIAKSLNDGMALTGLWWLAHDISNRNLDFFNASILVTGYVYTRFMNWRLRESFIKKQNGNKES